MGFPTETGLYLAAFFGIPVAAVLHNFFHNVPVIRTKKLSNMKYRLLTNMKLKSHYLFSHLEPQFKTFLIINGQTVEAAGG